MEKQTIDAEFQKLKDKYPFKDWQDHARITEKWRNAGWEIQKVWELYDKEEITQSRARELTRYIIDSYANLPNQPSIDIRSISEKWVGIWQRGENPNLFQCVDEAIKEALKTEPSIDEKGYKCPNCGRRYKSYYKASMCCYVNEEPEPYIQEGDKLSEIRNKLYHALPKGQIEAFTLIRIIADHLKELDAYIDSQPQPLQEDCHCTPDQTTGHTGGKCNVCGKDVEEAAIQHADSLHKKGSSELAGNGKLTENDCWENAYFNFKEGSKVKKVEVKWEENMK